MSDLLPDPVAAEYYLDLLFGSADNGCPDDDGWLSTVAFRDGGCDPIGWFPVGKRAQAARTLTDAAAVGGTRYLGMGLRRKELPHPQRGKAADVIGIPGLWVDVDYRMPGAHARRRPAR